jgi:hypothetical protein
MGLATVVIKGRAKAPRGLYARPPSNSFKGGGIIWLYVGRDVGTAVEYYLSN